MGKNNIPEIKKQLLSILENGKESPFINDFVYECSLLSKAYIFLNVDKYKRDKILENYGFADETDLAVDCIAEVFEERENEYYQIRDFFGYQKFNPVDALPESVFSKLRCLIWSATSERIYELSNPFYVKIRKSVNICFDRDSSYRKYKNGEKTYIYSLPEENPEIKKQLTPELIADILFNVKETNNSTPKLIEEIFRYLETSEEYSKSVEFNILILGLIEYHKKRINENLRSENFTGQFAGTTEFTERFSDNLKEFLNKKKSFYKSHLYKKENYVFTCLKKELNFEHPVHNSSELIIFLFNAQINNIELDFILSFLFREINLNNEYLKALKFKILNTVLSNFYIVFLQAENV